MFAGSEVGISREEDDIAVNMTICQVHGEQGSWTGEKDSGVVISG